MASGKLVLDKVQSQLGFTEVSSDGFDSEGGGLLSDFNKRVGECSNKGGKKGISENLNWALDSRPVRVGEGFVFQGCCGSFGVLILLQLQCLFFVLACIASCFWLAGLCFY